MLGVKKFEPILYTWSFRVMVMVCEHGRDSKMYGGEFGGECAWKTGVTHCERVSLLSEI